MKLEKFFAPALLASILSGLAGAACSDDDDTTDGTGGVGATGGEADTAGTGNGGQSGGTAGAGGSSTNAGAAGDTGTAGAASGGEAGSTGGQGGSGPDRDVLRPEELPFEASYLDLLETPPGFTINVFRQNMGNARMLATYGPYVYVTRTQEGDVVRLQDADGDGVAETQSTVATDIPFVHGIVFNGDTVFLADVKHVYTATVGEDGTFGPLTAIISDLPDGGQHPRRTLGIGPDGLLYISIGSSCDACEETNPEHATIVRSTLAGQPQAERTIVASGLRNTIGFAWEPETQLLWGMDQGSDWRGDDLPPEELNLIESGQHYGWPYCFAERHVDPVIQDPPDITKEQFCAATTPPVLLNQAHESPIAFAFYTGDTFPAEYDGDAFIAFRGSWNRIPATGYKIARVTFEDGEPTGIEDFVTGFLIEEGTATFGRPAGLTVAQDGALLFTDDTSGVIYRVQAED